MDKLDIGELEKVPSGLSNLKNRVKVDILDVDKLVPAPTDLSKLSGVVKNEAVNEDVYDEFVKKVNAIDTSGLVKKTDYDARINNIKGEIPVITGLAATVALNAVKNE